MECLARDWYRWFLGLVTFSPLFVFFTRDGRRNKRQTQTQKQENPDTRKALDERRLEIEPKARKEQPTERLKERKRKEEGTTRKARLYENGMSFTDGHGVEVCVGGHAFICILYTCRHANMQAGLPSTSRSAARTHGLQAHSSSSSSSRDQTSCPE